MNLKLHYTIKCQCCPHKETTQLICCTNQLTGFYMRATLALSGLNMSVDHLLEEPEDVENARPILDTLQVHEPIRRRNISSFAIGFFLFGSDVDPYQSQWYDKTCGHKVNHPVDSNTCSFLLRRKREL